MIALALGGDGTCRHDDAAQRHGGAELWQPAREFASSSEANPALDQILCEYRTVYESCAPADARYLTHLMFVRPEEDRFATADLIRAMTVSGTAPELRATTRWSSR
jgi:hypothetical protein